ncbi:MAG: DUF4202 domain-containing protein [Methylococcus sp.]|nr:MAG: DUF4202 domain-containing protein [Methylococcus sp.]
MAAPRLETVIGLIDEANAQDPNSEAAEGTAHPREWLYGRRMSACLERFCPEASEALRIAARGQHIRRWEIPRSSYPSTREGYLKWRTFLYGFHADQVAGLMRHAGYEADLIERVKTLIQKRGIKTDDEVQTLEDVICLVFLEYHFAEFARTQDAEKLITIVRKTWNKMSDRGHVFALRLPFPESVQPLLARALSPDQTADA